MKKDEVNFIIDENSPDKEEAPFLKSSNKPKKVVNKKRWVVSKAQRKKLIIALAATVAVFVIIISLYTIYTNISNKRINKPYYYEVNDRVLYRTAEGGESQSIATLPWSGQYNIYQGSSLNDNYLLIHEEEPTPPYNTLASLYYIPEEGESGLVLQGLRILITYNGDLIYFLVDENEVLDYDNTFTLYEANMGKPNKVAEDIVKISHRADGRGFAYINSSEELYSYLDGEEKKIADYVHEVECAPYSDEIYFTSDVAQGISVQELCIVTNDYIESILVMEDVNIVFNGIEVFADGKRAYVETSEALYYFDGVQCNKVCGEDENKSDYYVSDSVMYIQYLHCDKADKVLSEEITYLYGDAIYYYGNGENIKLYDISLFNDDLSLPFAYVPSIKGTPAVDTQSKRFYTISNYDLYEGRYDQGGNTDLKVIAEDIAYLIYDDIGEERGVYGYVGLDYKIHLFSEEYNQIINSDESAYAYTVYNLNGDIVLPVVYTDENTYENSKMIYILKNGELVLLESEEIVDLYLPPVPTINKQRNDSVDYLLYSTKSKRDSNKLKLFATDGTRKIVIESDFSGQIYLHVDLQEIEEKNKY